MEVQERLGRGVWDSRKGEWGDGWEGGLICMGGGREKEAG